MRRFLDRFRFDWGLLAAMLLGVLINWPFLTRPSLPGFTDVEHHIYRTFEVLSAWAAGVWYTRWAPDLYHGYGYPVYNYYAPLTHYVAAAYGALIGGPTAGVKFVLVLSLFLGAVGTYLFGRELWGQAGGLVGSAVYALSPYLVFVDPHQRGAVPETLALGMAPWLFWAIARLQRAPTPRMTAVAAVIVAALSISHNLMSFACLGLAGLWFLCDQLFRETPTTNRRAVWLMVGGGVFVGLGLSAFMWLPAVLERDAVQYGRATVNTMLDIWKTFLPLGQIFAPVSTQDMFDVLYPKIGIAQYSLGFLGAASALAFRERRATLTVLTAIILGMIGLMLAESRPIWEALPLLQTLQFPYRVLGPMTIALATLAGASVRWMARVLWRHSAVAFTGGAVAASALLVAPYLDPLPWNDFGPVSVERIIVMERNWGIGTTANDEFLPTQVLSIPQATQSLLDSYETGTVDKINRTTLPAGAEVTVLEHGPILDRFQVNSPTDFPLRIYTFYWPGWTAYLDGAKTTLDIAEPEGWMVVSVPAGQHEVLVRLEDTPARTLSWIISAAALAGTLTLAAWRRRPAGQSASPDAPLPSADLAAGSSSGAIWVLPLVVAILMGGRAAMDAAHWWRARWTGSAVPGAQTQQFTPLEANIDFLAYDLEQTTAHPGDKIPLEVYWRAHDLAPANYRVFVHLIGPDGKLWGQSDKLHPGGTGVWMSGIPTSRWPLDRYFPDPHMVLVQPDAPPGQYQLIAGLWDEASGTRLHVIDATGQPTEADGVTLDTPITIQP